VTDIRYTLVSDGSSDRILIPILNWLLETLCRDAAIQPQWADLRWLRNPPKSLPERLRCALEYYPCNFLFIHRDAEAQNPNERRSEILAALKESAVISPAVCVIPVRMSEAWLLLNERAIRAAAGRPTGRTQLQLPHSDRAEQFADPKEVLFQALRDASECTGRRLNNLNEPMLRYRVAELIDDYSILRTLSAFQQLEVELKEKCTELGWI
jgi:hypothetical protein